MAADPRIKIKVQIFCGKEIAMGPGKADLLEAIAREGSISAAGRTLGISYRRCWLLVDTMNRCWAGPLVETALGGKQGGGARVSELGSRVLADYRSLQSGLAQSGEGEAFAAMKAALRDQPKAPRSA